MNVWKQISVAWSDYEIGHLDELIRFLRKRSKVKVTKDKNNIDKVLP